MVLVVFIFLFFFFNLHAWIIRTRFSGGSHEFQLFGSETGTIHKFSDFASAVFHCRRSSETRNVHSSMLPFIGQQTSAMFGSALPAYSMRVCFFTSSLYVSLALGEEKKNLPVCGLFTWQRHRAVWLMHSGLSLPGRLFHVLFIAVMCDRLPTDIILLIA